MNSPDPVSALLGRWRHRPAPAPDFTGGVWARIAADPSVGRRPAPLLRFPLALPLAAALAVMTGIGAGFSANRAQATEQMATAYARKIDPLQMTALTPPAAIPQHDQGHHHHP